MFKRIGIKTMSEFVEIAIKILISFALIVVMMLTISNYDRKPKDIEEMKRYQNEDLERDIIKYNYIIDNWHKEKEKDDK